MFRIRNCLMLLVGACLCAAPAWSGDDGVDLQAQSEQCLDCHDDVDAIAKLTVHNHQFGVSCGSCHGDGTVHIDDPDVGNIGTARGAEGMKVCLSCHESEVHQKRPGDNVHASASVFCSDCHAPHKEVNPPFPLLQKAETDLCVSCHTDAKTLMGKPFTHKLGHGVMSCGSCHDPHGGKGRKSFKAANISETCSSCHTEKRGPFIFEHVTGVTGDCMTCHEAHGSSNPRQLTRALVSQLCLECHSTTPLGNLGSQGPSSHDLTSPRYRDCTVCHTAVHGSFRSPKLLK